MPEEGGGGGGGGDEKKGSGGKGSYIGLVRTLAKVTRRKTNADVLHVQRMLRQCWLIRETGLDLDPPWPKEDAYAYYGTYIHETMHPAELLTLLADIERMGVHPDRCPVFLVLFEQILLREKHGFALMNAGSMPHTAMGLGEYGSYDNRTKASGKMTTSELAKLELGDGKNKDGTNGMV